jgi:hypothetical protein
MKKTKKKIFVIVERGLADVVESTVPPGHLLEVIDLDLIREGDPYPSAEAAECVRKLGRAY